MNAKLKNKLVLGCIFLTILGIGVYLQLNLKKQPQTNTNHTQIQQPTIQPTLAPTNFLETKHYSSSNINISFEIKDGFTVTKDDREQVNIGIMNEQQNIPEAIVITKNRSDFVNPRNYETCIEKEGELIQNTPCIVNRENLLDSHQTIGGRKTNHFYLILGQDAGTEVYETIEEPIIQARSSLVGGGNPLYSLLLTLEFK